jgi:hypothetical protein
LANLVKLKEQSLVRKIAVHEADKAQLATIFERINQAREQLMVRICCNLSAFIVSSICLGGDRSQSSQDGTRNSGSL